MLVTVALIEQDLLTIIMCYL